MTTYIYIIILIVVFFVLGFFLVPIMNLPVDNSLPLMTEQEIAKGWYYGTSAKRPGTPDAWVLSGKGTRSARWHKPNPGHHVSKIKVSLYEYIMLKK